MFGNLTMKHDLANHQQHSLSTNNHVIRSETVFSFQRKEWWLVVFSNNAAGKIWPTSLAPLRGTSWGMGCTAKVDQTWGAQPTTSDIFFETEQRRSLNNKHKNLLSHEIPHHRIISQQWVMSLASWHRWVWHYKCGCKQFVEIVARGPCQDFL